MDKQNTTTCSWVIQGVPRQLRDRFNGLSRALGSNGKEQLEAIVAVHIQSMQRKLRDGGRG